MDNKGKRSLPLDLKRSEAREALLRVIDRADIFITNLLPARRKKYGLDHESLLERHPSLLVGAVSGYGNGGGGADWPAFDYSAYWARTGMMDIMHDEGVAPSMQRPAVGDHAAAVNLVCGLMAAMRMRDATGEGRYVDVSLLQTGLHILGTDIANALVTREPPRRHDRRAAPNALWNSYPVAEGRWLLLVMIEADRYWPSFCEAIDRPDLFEDPRFENAWQRSHNCRELIAELESTFRERTLDAWKAPVNQVEEAIDDPQARAMGYFQEVDHPEAGRFETVGPPFRIDGCELGARTGAAPLGSDARDVLREAGLTSEELEKLV
ncbi:MAG: CaiB/BaiF CoA transferase family protein [Myxococcota bacterium]